MIKLKKLFEIMPSRQKFKRGDAVLIVTGVNKGRKAKIIGTYYEKYGGGQDMKNLFSLYVYDEKRTISWFKPKDLKPLKENTSETKKINEWKTIYVDKNNHEKFKYVSVYDPHYEEKLDSLSDEDLKAQIYYIKDVYEEKYGRHRGDLAFHGRLCMASVRAEMDRRGIR